MRSITYGIGRCNAPNTIIIRQYIFFIFFKIRDSIILIQYWVWFHSIYACDLWIRIKTVCRDTLNREWESEHGFLFSLQLLGTMRWRTTCRTSPTPGTWSPAPAWPCPVRSLVTAKDRWVPSWLHSQLVRAMLYFKVSHTSVTIYCTPSGGNVYSILKQGN